MRTEQVRAGTGSAHRGSVLWTDDGERVVLVSLESNPFHDPKTLALDGKRVEAEGYRVGSELRFLRVKVIG